MRLIPQSLVFAGVVAAAACGYTDPGDGSKTLEVVAEATYSADHTRMELRATVKKSGNAVPDAQVIFEDGDTKETWTLDPSDTDESLYHLDVVDGYHRRLELKITADSGDLQARLEGPGPHVIVNPKHNDILKRDDLGDTFDVEWEAKDGIAAENVRIELDGGGSDNTVNEDRGTYEINTSSLEDGDEGVHVVRKNAVDLAGGVGRSSFTMFYDAHNSFRVE